MAKQESSEGGVWVTTEAIYLKVEEVNDTLKEGLADLKVAVEKLADHETRLRAAESQIRDVQARPVITWKALLTTLGAAGAMVAAVTPFIDKLYGG